MALNHIIAINTKFCRKIFFWFSCSFSRYRQKMKSSIFKILLMIVDFAAKQDIHSFHENIRTFLKNTFLIRWIFKKIWQLLFKTTKRILMNVCLQESCLLSIIYAKYLSKIALLYACNTKYLTLQISNSYWLKVTSSNWRDLPLPPNPCSVQSRKR